MSDKSWQLFYAVPETDDLIFFLPANGRLITRCIFELLDDPSALGAYIYLVSLPDSKQQNISIKTLTDRFNIGKDKAAKLINILIFKNLLVIKTIRDEKGKFQFNKSSVNTYPSALISN